MARPETDECQAGSRQGPTPADDVSRSANPLPAGPTSDPPAPRLVLTISHDSRNCFIDLTGELDVSTLGLLDNAVADMCRSGYGTTVILGLRHLTFIDCAALGRIVGLRETLHSTGGRVLLLRPSRRVRRLLELTGLDTTLEVK